MKEKIFEFDMRYRMIDTMHLMDYDVSIAENISSRGAQKISDA
jgi:hypothetical protein